MVFEHIEKLKEQYTDQYVAVDESRPELARFRGLVGRVKTVNMSGRALVEFDDWINNIGWFDIEIDFLKVVDPVEVAAKTAAAKPAPQKKGAPPAEKKAKEPSAKPQATAKPPTADSTADILAAARGQTAPKSAKETQLAVAKGEHRPAEKGGGQMSVADMIAAARASAGGSAAAAKPKEQKPAAAPKAEKAAPAETKDRGGMSVADMMAAARAADSGAAAPAAKKESAPAKEAAPSSKPPTKPPAESAQPTAKKKAAGGMEISGMSVEQMLALARDQASGKAVPAVPSKEDAPAQPQAAEPPPPAEAPAEVPPPQAETPAPEQPAPSGELPKDIDGILAYCRQADG